MRQAGQSVRVGAPTKSGHVEASTSKRQHAAALKASGVSPFVLYTIRHTCITRWAKYMDPFTLHVLAGHTDMNTAKRYVHPSDDDIREADEPRRWARFGTRSFTKSVRSCIPTPTEPREGRFNRQCPTAQAPSASHPLYHVGCTLRIAQSQIHWSGTHSRRGPRARIDCRTLTPNRRGALAAGSALREQNRIRWPSGTAQAISRLRGARRGIPAGS